MPHRKRLALVGALVLSLAACGPDQRTSGKAARQEAGAASASPSAAVGSGDEDAQTTVRIYQL
ncbi:MAG TPA: hypothetical protein VHI31_08820, partial [Actinomycetota bacterium]|nr:hypothetical protein [Actinomycetota bacterium]